MLRKCIYSVCMCSCLTLISGLSVEAASVKRQLVPAGRNEVIHVSVTGKVVNEQGEALPGVTVLVKGVPEGTTTDVKGAFSLELPADASLVFSYLGYLPTEQIGRAHV